MNKSDLKSGMIVETRKDGEGNLGLLVQTEMGLLIQFKDGWDDVKIFKEDLTHMRLCSLDIISIRQPQYEWQIIRENMHEAPIIWQIKEEKRITMQEIADKFGCRVEEIKIVE